MDLPTAAYYEQLLAHYGKDAKFVLTERHPDAWFRSFSAYLDRLCKLRHGQQPATTARLLAHVYGSSAGSPFLGYAYQLSSTTLSGSAPTLATKASRSRSKSKSQKESHKKAEGKPKESQRAPGGHRPGAGPGP